MRWAAGRDRSSSVLKSMNSVLLVGCCSINVAKFRMRGELILNGLTSVNGKAAFVKTKRGGL